MTLYLSLETGLKAPQVAQVRGWATASTPMQSSASMPASQAFQKTRSPNQSGPPAAHVQVGKASVHRAATWFRKSNQPPAQAASLLAVVSSEANCLSGRETDQGQRAACPYVDLMVKTDFSASTTSAASHQT